MDIQPIFTRKSRYIRVTLKYPTQKQTTPQQAPEQAAPEQAAPEQATHQQVTYHAPLEQTRLQLTTELLQSGTTQLKVAAYGLTLGAPR
jgi:hypothetical protein